MATVNHWWALKQAYSARKRFLQKKGSGIHGRRCSLKPKPQWEEADKEPSSDFSGSTKI